ncbi:MAG TPA: hypothetical protein VGE92_13460, partial [Steroidobacteraceae bacterium]
EGGARRQLLRRDQQFEAASWTVEKNFIAVLHQRQRAAGIGLGSHVQQADRGCDLDFLTGASGSTVERESH